MRIKLLAVFLALAVVGVAFYLANHKQSGKPQLEARFDRALVYLGRRPSTQQVRDTDFGRKPRSVYGYKDFAALVNQVEKPRSSEQWNHFRSLLILELTSPEPKYRALACELLGMSLDATVIPEIGKLLDDPAKAMPEFVSGPWDLVCLGGSRAQSKKPVLMRSVRRVAYQLLYQLTENGFGSRREFDEWWRENSDYRNHSWYWRMRWEGKSQTVGVAQRIRDISALPDDAVLRAVFRTRMSWDDQTSDGKLLRFLEKRKLRPRIIRMLRQEDLLPQINSQRRFEDLVHAICDLGQSIFAPEDEPLIARAEQVRSPFKPPVADLVLLRESIVLPHNGHDRAVDILADALRKDPAMVTVADELVNISGSTEAAVLERSFKSVSVYEKSDLASWVSRRAGQVGPSFIRDLVQLVPDPAGEGYCEGGLSDLSRAANRVLHRRVISEREIDEVEAGQYATGRKAADALRCFARIKRKLLQELPH